MPKILKESLKTIEAYKTTNPHYVELLDILSDILILREEYRNNMADVFTAVDESLISKKMVGGLPLIDFSCGCFDLSKPREYFLALLDIAEKRAPGETTELAEKIRNGSYDFEKMVLNSFYMQEDEPPAEMEEDFFDLIELFLEESLRPSLEIVAQKYAAVIARSEWSEGYCPICGKEPKIGQIRGEEGRFLFCNQCGFEWHFLRIKCPFCSNEEQQSLAYFTVEGNEQYRVDVCNECKRYIKIVDFRESKREPNLDVEDIATLHLDILANEEGYE
ncbi:MAG: formate dehydrogenase accessory protein FdhE [Deltaproteobacteria bacterium HGW-Deltaproteobacteria-9]|nr:MAG: formate dehydrogenase accessory protein FdhE [Deltaproteobacteria bacterium HGW-Deltaproteobacteria-9]